MAEEGMIIPIGADLAELQQAFAQINSHVAKMGAKISADLEKSQSAFGRTAKAAQMISSGFSRVWQSVQAGAAAAFRTIGSMAMKAASVVGSAFRGIASLPGKILSIPGLPIAGLRSAAGAMALFTSQMKKGMDTASQFERASISLEALTGSGKKASAILDSIRATWLKTGVALEGQAPNIQKFLALGFSSDSAVKLQKNILDIAGAVGMTGEESMRLGSALAQVKAKGIVSMEELRQQIAEKGVPVFEALAAKIGVSQAALIKMVSDGKVPAQSLIDVFMDMEGVFSRFRGGAERLGGTFSGLVSRIRGAWDMLLAKFATPINDALKPVLEAGIEGITGLMAKAEEFGKSVGKTISSLFGVFKRGEGMELFKAGLHLAFVSATDTLLRGFRAAVAFIATALPPVISAAFQKLQDRRFWSGLTQMFEGIGHSIATEIRAALPGADAGQMDLNRQAAALKIEAGGLNMALAGQTDLSEVIRRSLVEGLAAARNAAGGVSQDVIDARAVIDQLMTSGLRRVEAEKAAAEIFGQLLKEKPSPSNSAAAGLNDTVNRAIAPAVMSLTRIGGGGYASTVNNNLFAEAKRQTGFLKTIAKNTASKPTSTARFA